MWSELGPPKKYTGTRVQDGTARLGTFWRRLLGFLHLFWIREVVVEVSAADAGRGWHIGYIPWWKVNPRARFSRKLLVRTTIRLKLLSLSVTFVAIDRAGHEIPLTMRETISRADAKIRYGSVPLL